ncbi:DEAD/DEAH box helicase [Aquipuribacter nitratireducens]|uniref:DEAD/DEAH box helicase n=1 Tax=Aquipuribacter nitratireducens TaxID=650104 RepID=A0ABW0GSX5_9MICO
MHVQRLPGGRGGDEALPAAARAVLASPRAGACVRHVLVDPPRPATTAAWPAWVHPALVASLARQGIERPWSHQVEVAEAVHAGHHVVVSAGTASGKSLGFLLPALSGVLAALDGGATARHSAPCALYLSPTKALAADQERRLRELAAPGVVVGTVDGDASREQRDWVRDNAHVVLSNPDLLAHTLLPDHARWTRMLRRLRWVVLDECHVYRGVFGAHVGAVLRRLRRVAAAHGARPVTVLCSATVAEPGAFAARLLGEDVVVVDHDGAPRPGRTTLLWDPVLETAGAGPVGDVPVVEEGVPAAGSGPVRRRSAAAESADLLARLVGTGTRTLAFAPSRRGSEAVAAQARDALVAAHGPGAGGDLARAVVPYRGGHLPEERRATEHALRSGELLGVAATSALELGIDVTGLDAVLLAGWPGSLASFRQRLGRAGRADVPGTGVLVARDDPLDAYVLAHPERVLDGPHEGLTTDPDNPYVLLPHLAAAAAELPLTEVDLALFGPAAPALVEVLVERGDLRRRPGGWYWARPERPTLDLRGSGGGQVQLVEAGTGRVLGTVDTARACSTVHPGAVYQHLLRTYLVEGLDLDEGCAVLRPAEPGYVTFARSATRTRVVREVAARPLGAGGRLGHGPVDVVEQVTGFVRVDPLTGTVLGQELLDLPERSFRTQGTWFTAPPGRGDSGERGERGARGARGARGGSDDHGGGRLAASLHAAEHALTSLVPLVTVSDRFDVAGTYDVHHPDLDAAAVLVHDTWPGGAGFAEQVHARADDLLAAAGAAVGACACAAGCPGCVVRPGCGAGNQPLDKAGGLGLLRLLAG